MTYIEVTGKTVEEAKQEALKALSAEKLEDLEIEVLEEGASGILGLGGKEAKIKAALKQNVIFGRLEKFLHDLLILMELDASQKITVEEGLGVKVNLEGEDLAVLIGRQGSTLEAIQLITNIAVNKGLAEKTRIIIDAKGYKERRDRALKDMALREAEKVKEEKRSIILNPMSPSERRVIHLALQDHPHVKTYSSGEEPLRKIIIALKEE